MVKRYNYKNPKPAQWHEGPRYDISVAQDHNRLGGGFPP